MILFFWLLLLTAGLIIVEVVLFVLKYKKSPPRNLAKHACAFGDCWVRRCAHSTTGCSRPCNLGEARALSATSHAGSSCAVGCGADR